MFSFKYSARPNTLADKRLPDDVEEGEKTKRIVALQAKQRTIQTELNLSLVGREVAVLIDAASRRRDTESPAGPARMSWSTCPDPRGGWGVRSPCGSSTPQLTASGDGHPGTAYSADTSPRCLGCIETSGRGSGAEAHE